MNLKKLFGKAVTYAKNNPKKVLIVASVIAPGVVGKLAPKIAPVIVALGRKS